MAGDPPKKTSKLAVAAFVLSLLLCIPLVPILGAVLGVVALLRIEKQPELRGRGLAIASIPLGCGSVVLAGILAAIAIPSFLQYMSRAKQYEARVLLETVQQAQASRAAETGHYVSLPELGVQFEPERRYTVYRGADVLPATLEEPLPLPEDYETGVWADGFKACAVGNPDADDDIDVWCIDAHGEPENVRPDLSF